MNIETSKQNNRGEKECISYYENIEIDTPSAIWEKSIRLLAKLLMTPLLKIVILLFLRKNKKLNYFGNFYILHYLYRLNVLWNTKLFFQK